MRPRGRKSSSVAWRAAEEVDVTQASSQKMEVQALLEHLRAAAASRGREWLEGEVSSLLGESSGGAGDAQDPPARRPGRRARPPQRLSPDVTPRARRSRRSPSRDPPVQRARPAVRARPSRAGRNPGRRAGPAGDARPRPAAGLRSVVVDPSGGTAAVAAGLPDDVPVRGAASRREDEQSRGSDSWIQSGQRLAGLLQDDGGRVRSDRESNSESPGPSGGWTTAGSVVGSQRRAMVAPVEESLSGTASRLDGSEARREERHQEVTLAAGGPTAPAQPGEYMSSFVCPVTDFRGVVGPGAGVAASCEVAAGRPAVDVDEFRALASSVKVLLERLGGSGTGAVAGSPVSAWVQPELPLGGSPAASAGGQVSEQPGRAGSVCETEKEREGDGVRLDDRAKGEVYVCFEGPLGAHLKQEIREKIWKDEYVEIFSLLPLEKFNLDKVKKEEKKKEDEEKRRWRLIPQTFTNWLQAFAILASVVGEKAPENCSALFGYMDAIGEAHRVYGGMAWLRYDEQFRQRKAVRPSIRWDHKDIGLWLRVMTPTRVGQPFSGGAGSAGQGGVGSGSGGSGSGAGPKGLCWQFNDGQCKYGTNCRFKHVCSICNGTSHGSAKCFRKGKGKGQSGASQGSDPGEGSRDGAVSK